MKKLMNKTVNELTNKFMLKTATASILLTLGNSSLAAPGTLSNSPLFLTGTIQPNLFFMIDDSGSMNWEVLLSNGALAAGGTPNSGTLDFTPDNATENIELCLGYNTLAYDPNTTYTPWEGLDEDNIAYSNRTLTTALNDPFDNDDIDNVSTHFYYQWNDANNDNVYQVGECNTATANRILVNTLPLTQQQNYANWYSYYRKREYVAKRALSSVIKSSTARAGLATLHNNNTVRTLIQDIDDISTPVNATAVTAKNALLRNLFRINSTGGTPLRQALESVGEYYENGGTWSPGNSPILGAGNGGECQQNFTVLMSDGTWNGGNPAAAVGDADTDGNTAYDGGLYADGTTLANTDPTSNPITVGTLADVAMHYYERDLAPLLSNSVPTITGIDDNNTQHMVTYTVAFGVDGTLPSTLNPGDLGFAWPAPFDNQPETIDDMRHAAYNGRGQFLSAGDPQQLITSLDTAIKDIQSRTTSASAVAFNSTSLQTNSKVFRASFDTDRWSGELSAHSLTLDTTTNLLTVSAIPSWKASTDINSRTPGSRNIVTFDGSNGINFDWSSITTAHKDDLRTDSSGAQNNDATGMARLEFIRGSRGCEQNSTGTCSHTDGTNTFTSKSLRQRNSVLGDIIHSSPTHVKESTNRYPENIESVPYSSFASSNKTRAGTTYVGSNDGMLHAFNDSGTEVFAYIPNLIYSTANGQGLHHLTEPGYIHQYYVDLTTTSADAYFNNGTSTNWHTVLLGGLRGGGKGVFALDITNPASLGTSSVLWEFTHNDLGYSFSEARISRLNNGKWAAIFGNGYNSDPAGDGTSKIFIVYLDGSNVSSPITLETNAGSISNGSCSDAGSDCNGMSTPSTADINGDGAIDYIYAGDLHGNLWSFDVSSTVVSNWKSAYGTGPTYKPLFQACDSVPCTTSNRQPITSKPSVTRHPFKRDITTRPNLMVFFGTGQYITSADKTSTAQQSFYGVWDSGTGDKDRDDLVAQTITDSATAAGIEARTVTDNNVDYSTKLGWRIDFPTQKERVVTDSVKFGKSIFFNTMIPTLIPCESGGFGWRMALDIVNGGVPDFIPIDVNNDGKFDTLDKVNGVPAVGTKSPGIPAAPRFIGNYRVDNDTSSGAASATRVQPYELGPPDRMSWTIVEPN